MESDTKKRQVTSEQLKCLLGFMKDNPVLAKGLTRGRRGRLQTLKVWDACAKLLNVSRNGAIKDGKGWSKYWCDWKYRVRRRALELRAAEENNKPPPDGITQLSDMEITILNIIGHDSVDGVVIKNDPLADGTIETDTVNGYHDLEAETNQCTETQPTTSRKRKRRHSSNDLSDLDSRSECNSPQETKPEVKPAENKRAVDSDADNEVGQFLELEKEGLGMMKRTCNSLETIANHLSKLADTLSNIGDFISNNRHNDIM